MSRSSTLLLISQEHCKKNRKDTDSFLAGHYVDISCKPKTQNTMHNLKITDIPQLWKFILTQYIVSYALFWNCSILTNYQCTA